MKTKVKCIEYGPANDAKRMHNHKGVRWVENVSHGLRRVGFADEVARTLHSRAVDHKGWFTDDDMQSEVYRGIVYQLPARHGAAQYVYGYADPNNDDCALLSFDVETDLLDAARSADGFAEAFADDARSYNAAWSAGQLYRDLGDNVTEMRKEALAIAAEMREARKAAVQAPTICATVRNQIMSIYRMIQKARKERAALLDNFGSTPGFTE